MLDGRVLLTASPYGQGQSEIYDPVDNSWSAPPLPCACQYGHLAALLPSGRVVVAGGTPGPDFSRSTTVFDPVKKKWLPGPDMPLPARSRGSSTTNIVRLEGSSCAPRPEDCGKVLLAGGQLDDTSARVSTLLFSENP